MKQYKVGIIGATGMVGQRFVLLCAKHPWFKLTVLAASEHSAGKTYRGAIGSRWHMTDAMPDEAADMIVMDAEKDAEKIAEAVDFVFCAVNMKKDEIKALEERYAKLECPVVSNNSAHRWTPDVPMVVPEINADHIRIDRALVCTYQAISGAGKTFETWPEMIDNVIPYIGGEEEKSEQEPLKLWGHIDGDQIVCAAGPSITAQCLRVPCSDGHMAACFVKFAGEKPSIDEIKSIWANYQGRAQELKLPSAPEHFLHYFEEADRPQTKLDRMLEGGMAVSIGRLREDTQYDYKFVCLSHNTLRGAAGGAVLLAELLCAEGYITTK